MDFEPQALVIASGNLPWQSLTDALIAEGWRIRTVDSLAWATAALKDSSFDVVLLDVTEVSNAQEIADLRASSPERYLPVLGLGDVQEESAGYGLDLLLAGTPHPAQITLRLEQLLRAAVAEEEFELRRETFSGYGVSMDTPDEQVPPISVLAVGAADHRFLGLSNSLEEAGVQVVAAPTPYTAFDYLHERNFDAAVLWGGENRAVAMSIASGMKRNTRLYHIPIMLYLQKGEEVNLADLYRRGFADVAEGDVSEQETGERINALARHHRRRVVIRRALDSARSSHLTDPVTGLFLREPFASHLGRVYSSAKARRRPLSLCVLKVVRTENLNRINKAGWLDRALPQVGAMVSRLVRVEDTAASLASDTFALMMPATRADSARLAAERIAAVIACTAFEAGEGRSPFVIEFDIGVAEMMEGEGPVQLLERAVSDARQKMPA